MDKADKEVLIMKIVLGVTLVLLIVGGCWSTVDSNKREAISQVDGWSEDYQNAMSSRIDARRNGRTPRSTDLEIKISSSAYQIEQMHKYPSLVNIFLCSSNAFTRLIAQEYISNSAQNSK